jgi:hypothetical protein
MSHKDDYSLKKSQKKKENIKPKVKFIEPKIEPKVETKVLTKKELMDLELQNDFELIKDIFKDL